ncbi:alpha/beta-hydrolase [Meredithblackwellia eburnea MCA 4105]
MKWSSAAGYISPFQSSPPSPPSLSSESATLTLCVPKPTMRSSFATILVAATLASSTPLPKRASAPTVTLDYGTFVGFNEAGVNNFLGVPYAQPPVGDLRYRLPVFPPSPLSGTQYATNYSVSCTQLGGNQQENAAFAALPSSVADALGELTAGQVLTTGEGEDCLTVNVKIPDSTTTAPAGGFPVLVWIYGGGFATGGSASYAGSPIVKRSIALGTPMIYVSFNYRLNGFGFLNSKELSAAGVGNLGLQDQRAALRWVNRYISKFGGNPSQVVIWGESAGAISVAHQMLGNGGNNEGLFRGVFANSGSPIPVGSYTGGQQYFDQVAQGVGCYGQADVLACLRLVPYTTLRDTINTLPTIFAYQSLNEPWFPRVDGTFITDTGMNLVAQGKYAKVPLVTGDCDDEGTLFSLVAQTNVTTPAAGDAYLQRFFFPQATPDEAAQVLALYPSDPTVGSPFDTGILNQFTPQFKRLASFQGDFAFQAPRRYFLNTLSKTQKTWSFLYKRLKATPFLGTFHGTDIIEGMYAPLTGSLLGDFQFMDYLINFVVGLDPNPPTPKPNLLQWPTWDNSTNSPSLMTFTDTPVVGTTVGLSITPDTYRKPQMEFLSYLGKKYPLVTSG